MSAPTPEDLWVGLTGLAAAAAAAALLTRLAPRLGWLDAAAGAEAERKLQARPVPPIGGAALMVGWGLQGALGATPWRAAGAGPLAAPPGAWPWLALGLAFLVGLGDDLSPRGASAGRKLAGQAAVGLALAAPGWGGAALPGALASTALWVAATCLATNLWNTFDNADGAAAGLGALGLGAARALGAGPVLGFLPFNLLGRPREADRAEGARRTPAAYLGDSGSHALAVVLLLTPAAWPVFLLPGLDLGRLVLVRCRAGQSPWIGDRRHLAHRLQRRGLGRPAVLATLLVAGGAPLVWPGFGGLVLGVLAFVLALRATRASG